MHLHRGLGYVYLIIYIYLMWQMVPRLWTYQVELPARTVGHLVLGMSIGAILLVKIAIVRLFKHLEGTLVPFLETALFIATVLLMGLALPFSFHESSLRRATLGTDAMRQERLERLRALLPLAGLGDEADVAYLASAEGLLEGREVLRTKCVQCHDLRTVLARPRTPDAWRQTVQRMAERSTVLNPITETDVNLVTAYLIAITPTLQRTAQLKREQSLRADSSMQAVQDAMHSDPEMAYEASAAQRLFETKCSQCHSPTFVETSPPDSDEAAAALVGRMVTNGLFATETELAWIIRYITETYVH